MIKNETKVWNNCPILVMNKKLKIREFLRYPGLCNIETKPVMPDDQFFQFFSDINSPVVSYSRFTVTQSQEDCVHCA